MGRRISFLGGGSILYPGKDGLEWESSDPAGSKPAQKRSKRWDERAPTHKEIERQSKQDDIAESKLIRSFVSQCVKARSQGLLPHLRPRNPD
jgi:hypothetical protein